MLMKKQIIALMEVTILSAGMLVGCGGNDNTNNESDATHEVTTELVATNEITSDNATTEETTSNSSGANADNIISEEEAKNIALKDAGVKEGSVTNIRIELDFDDGRQEYDVDFYVGDKEFEYTISAEDGSILEKDADIDNDF